MEAGVWALSATVSSACQFLARSPRPSASCGRSRSAPRQRSFPSMGRHNLPQFLYLGARSRVCGLAPSWGRVVPALPSDESALARKGCVLAHAQRLGRRRRRFIRRAGRKMPQECSTLAIALGSTPATSLVDCVWCSMNIAGYTHGWKVVHAHVVSGARYDFACLGSLCRKGLVKPWRRHPLGWSRCRF